MRLRKHSWHAGYLFDPETKARLESEIESVVLAENTDTHAQLVLAAGVFSLGDTVIPLDRAFSLMSKSDALQLTAAGRKWLADETTDRAANWRARHANK